MASLRSLGLHKPSALPFLIAEGILSEDATEDDYSWQLCTDTESAGAPEEELVTTEYHVVWSRGGVVRKVFNFEVEEEKVVQALLTWFPTEEIVPADLQDSRATTSDRSGTQTPRPGTQESAVDATPAAVQPPRYVEGRSRALVILLKSQAHIFFLSGATHMVNLPFEVERAFPAERGLLLQRRIPRTELIPPTPLLPSAPPNSFISATQSFFSQSFTQTPRRIGSALGPSRLSTFSKPGASAPFLDELIKGFSTSSTDGLPRLFSFTDPLLDLGLVVNSVVGDERGRLLSVGGSKRRRLEPVDKAEEVIYVSSRNEIQFDQSSNDKPLLLTVTANYDTNVFTIWSASYLEPRPISSSLKRHHSASSAHKFRRRSSFAPSGPGTGAATPVPRGNDRLRESIGGAPTRSRTAPTSQSMARASQAQDKLSDEAVEDAIASQLDPNYEMIKAPKESRRVSSLLSRAELSSSFDKTAFQDRASQRTSLGGNFGASFGSGPRRGHSLGGVSDRTSLGGFGPSRHRASTPGSVASRTSFGGASVDDTFDDIMDEDSFDTVEEAEELEELRPHSARGGDEEAVDGLRKEMAMKKVAEIPVQQYLKTQFVSHGNQKPEGFTKVFVMAAPFNSATLPERRLYVYILHPSLRNPIECEFSVARRRLPTSSSTPKRAGAPKYACTSSFIKTQELIDAVDVTKIVDGRVGRLVCLSSTQEGGPSLSLTVGWGAHLPMKYVVDALKLFHPYAIMRDSGMRRTAGLKRTISPTLPLQRLLPIGVGGNFDIVDREGRRHCLQMQLSPHDTLVSQIFKALGTILPNHIGHFLLEIWWSVRRYLAKELNQIIDPEWAALVITLSSMAVPFIGGAPTTKSKSAKPHKKSSARLSNQAILPSDLGNDASAWKQMCNREVPRLNQRDWGSSPWSWVQKARPSHTPMNSPSSRSGADHLLLSEHIKAKKGSFSSSTGLARQFMQSPIGIATNDQWRRLSVAEGQDMRTTYLPHIVVLLHLLHEENKLNFLSQDYAISPGKLAALIAQLGHWLRWEGWDWKQGSYYDLNGGSADDWEYEQSHMSPTGVTQPWDSPPSILGWINSTLRSQLYESFPTLSLFVREPTTSPRSPINVEDLISTITPRTIALIRFFRHLHEAQSSPRKAVELIPRSGISLDMLSTLPEAARTLFMEAIIRCQANPPTTWSTTLLRLIQREDLDLSLQQHSEFSHDVQPSQWSSMMGLQSSLSMAAATRDIHTICQNTDRVDSAQSSAEAERHQITRLIFQEDRRYVEAHSLLEPLRQPVAEYRPENREEAAILEGQKVVMQWVMIRTFSLPVGSSMIKFSCKKPLPTEKFALFGFSTSCLMKPMGNVMTAERANYSEEKYFWAFFNAGVAAGLSISRDAQGIDTSWILYNKPAELTNKHAGLLLGLGLNGHLKNMARWLSFKYLTPKHTMTSVGLLIGLSVSFMGTMDSLVTKLCSVHVTRMMPPGSADLNLSPQVQTAGLMGIGLLYYNTQHRRISEIMLSEIEFIERRDPAEPPDTLRDEAYRLATGFALGWINLGKGNDLRGLHDMRVVERLLAVAVAPKPVDLVHILDQATAGAVIAVALIFMKTHNKVVARKIDIPDTLPQFDYVRPDIFLLRTLAKHLIMWDDIRAEPEWIKENLPVEHAKDYDLTSIHQLRSEQMPFFNIIAGLLWSISLKYAGTGDVGVGRLLVRYLDQFMRICKLPAIRYDARLARNTVRNCQDLVALSAATVMAGTGDLDVFRRLRALHGRVGADYPYGSHLAAHMAMGALFLGGGTHTFSTSNKAIAALICAFYPLFPMEVQDSKAHLQAFRHMWVLAAEPRCVIVRDVDTGRAITMSLLVRLKSGDDSLSLNAPCLLPDVSTIASITTTNIEYWPSTLDFVHNPAHFALFRTNQTLHVRRRSAHEMHASTFSASLVALNDTQSARTARLMWDWLFTLPSLRAFEKSDIALILPTDPYSGTFLETSGTVVDQRLALAAMSTSWTHAELADLKGLFEWAESAKRRDGRLRWLGRQVLERLKAGVLERGRGIRE